MRKKKLLSFVMSLVMLVSVFVGMLTFSASASEPAQPTVLPDGSKIERALEWGPYTKENALSDGAYCKAGSISEQLWGKTGKTTRWRGASGMMFYIDAGTAQEVDFLATFIVENGRLKSDKTEYKNSQLKSLPSPNTLGESVAYYYNSTDSTWNMFGLDDENVTQLTSASGSGWYYLPFSSIYYWGGAGTLAAGDVAAGWTLDEYMMRQGMSNNNEALQAMMTNVCFSSTNTELKFGKIYFVHEDKSDTAHTSGTAMFGGSIVKANAEGSADVSVSGDSYTVTGLSGNSVSSSANRLWLRGANAQDLKGAVGIRFHVDTTALGEAQLRLRLRMIVASETPELTNTLIESSWGVADQPTSGPDPLGYASAVPNGYDQFVTRVNGAAYYYVDGAPVPLYHYAGSTESGNSRIDKETAGEGDIFDALPAGYVGDIFIPMDSFGYSFDSYNSQVLLPWDLVAEKYSVDQIALCGAYTGTPTADSVVYSDFEVLYSAIPQHDITFVVEGSENVVKAFEEGTTPKFPNGTPTKAETNEFAYDFAGWKAEGSEDVITTLPAVTGAATYTAQFTPVPKYKITFKVEGQEDKIIYVREGDTPNYGGYPQKAEDETNRYSFDKWDKEIAPATEEATYTAVFKVKPKNTAASDTTAPDTTAPATTTAPAEEKGCGGAIGLASVAVVVMSMGAAIVIKKKED